MNFTLIRKEIRENIFGVQGLLWLFVAALVLSGLSLGFMSIKELSLMAQNEILVTMEKIILGIALLITIILGAVSISAEREQATLESLLLSPTTPRSMAASKFAAIFFLWILVFLVSTPYLYAMGYGTGVFLETVVVAFLATGATVAAFAWIAIGFSILLRSSRNALIVSLLSLFVFAIPMFLSTVTKQSGFARIIDIASPLSNAMYLYKAMIITRSGFEILWQYLLPLGIFVGAAYGFFRFAVHKMSFEGGD